jgi:hypothetical protein
MNNRNRARSPFLLLSAIALAFLSAGCGGGGGTGASITQASLQKGLIHWWKFDEDATDSIGSLSSAPLGPVTYISGAVGQAIVFNGTTTGISLPATTDMQFQASFSLSAWAKLYSYPTNSQIWATIIFDGDDRNGLDPYDLQVSPSGTLQFLTTSSTQALGVNAPTQFPLNQYVFVTGTYDKKAGIQSLYVNGVLVGQNNNVKDLTPVVPLDPTALPGVGIGVNNAFPTSAYNMGWNGEIDDLRVYNRALSSAEVQALYNFDLTTSN